MRTPDRNPCHNSFNPNSYAKRLLPMLLIVCIAISLPIAAAAQAGQLDKTFGQGGIFNTALSGSSATAVAFQSDGGILVAGQIAASTATQPGVVRLTANGALDTSFGNGGVASVNLHLGGGEQAIGVIVQSDGKIVMGMATFLGDGEPTLRLARFNANGTLDTSFGNSGTGTALLVGALMLHF